MKLIGFMCCVNAEEFIEYSIRSTIEHLDKLIIIEGGWKEYYEVCGNKRSTDKTIEIIKKLQHEFIDKIDLYFHNEKNQLIQRSQYFKYAPIEEHWMLLQDADEIYPPKSIDRIRRFVNGEYFNPIQSIFCDVLKFKSLVFINDFYHVSEVIYPRLFKVRGGLEKLDNGEEKLSHWFLDPNKIGSLRAGGHYLQIGNENPEVSDITYWEYPEIEFFHYSYCHSFQRFMEKKKERTKAHGWFAWNINEKGLVVRSDANIKEYTGKHPMLMESHPKYGIRLS